MTEAPTDSTAAAPPRVRFRVIGAEDGMTLRQLLGRRLGLPVGPASEVIRVLVAKGFVANAEADGAIEALAEAGLIESALWQAVIDEAEDATNQ